MGCMVIGDTHLYMKYFQLGEGINLFYFRRGGLVQFQVRILSILPHVDFIRALKNLPFPSNVPMDINNK